MSFQISKIQGTIIGVIMAVVFLAVGVALGPTVIEYFGLINVTTMADVELGSVLVLMASFAPLFYYLAVIGGSIVLLVASVKTK